MDDKTAAVLNGFLSLSSSEQEDFVREANKVINNPNSTDVKKELRKSIQESIRRGEVKIVLGPSGPDFCPCCGQST